MVDFKGKGIADVRKDLGMSQDDMASELGIVRQTVAKYEREPESMTIQEARSLCAVLGKRYADLFFATLVN